MAEIDFPISDRVIAVLQSASLSHHPAAAAALHGTPPGPPPPPHPSLQRYIAQHSLMMQCVVNLRDLWPVVHVALHSDEPLAPAAHPHSLHHSDTHTIIDQCLHSTTAPLPRSLPAYPSAGQLQADAHHLHQLQAQITSLKARVQDLELELAAAASRPPSSLTLSPAAASPRTSRPLDSPNITPQCSALTRSKSPPRAQPPIALTAYNACDALVLKCAAAVSSSFKLHDTTGSFIRKVFDRHMDVNTGGLPAFKLVIALTDADAPFIPHSAPAAAASPPERNRNSDALLTFSEFARAAHAPDELALYFQEKRQPLLADALRALVGRGNDQLLRVSQLAPSDVRAASEAVCVVLVDEAMRLHHELQLSFAAQFEIQAQMQANAGKFNVVKMACGGIHDFHSGLTGRVGTPHLKFKDAMRQEHCEKAGCNVPFTTGNYKITTSPKQEWLYVAGDDMGNRVACPDMGHSRRIERISDLLQLPLAVDAKLTEVEMMAIVLYTGPMFQVYNCILRRFPADTYSIFDKGGNRYATTIFVLVSAVQKVSRCTRIPEGTLLYRGLGGLIDLPDNFHAADAQGRSGYLDWGMMSTSSDRDVALGYSGVKQRRPRAMVMVIEATSVDRGADISEFSQYPGEKEFLWVPCSFVQRTQRGAGRVQVVDGGLVEFVPVRVNLNLKTETVEELLEKKKSMHVSGFEFRVSELKVKLQDIALAGNAEARLQKDIKSAEGYSWASRKVFSVGGYIDAQVNKVQAVLERHRARCAADYCDDAVYRRLVAESLDVVSMAHSALVWWLEDCEQRIHGIEDQPLLYCHRRWESFLRLRYTCAEQREGRRIAALALCRARNLLCSDDANEHDDNDEGRLLALCAGGGSSADLQCIVAAGAHIESSNAAGQCAMTLAAQQGHVDVITALISLGAGCNVADKKGFTPLMACCWTGHLDCVEALLHGRADVNQAKCDGGTPLLIASQQGHPAVLEALIRRGADVNKSKTNGDTPLLIASLLGHSTVVSVLIRAGADVNSARLDGATPLSAATEKGYSSIVKALVEGGARWESSVKKRRDDSS